MSWIKWVARPDVPLKDALTTWAIGNTVEETNIWGYPELMQLPKVHIMYLGPFVHLHRERNIAVFVALVNIFKTKNSKCYLELSEKYHRLAEELLEYLEEVFKTELIKLSNDDLRERFDEFVQRYLKYAPVINSGAAGDWLYRSEFDPFIREMSARLISRARSQAETLPIETRLVLSTSLGTDEEVDARIQKLLRERLTFSDRPTYGELKDEAIWDLAIAIEASPKANLALAQGGAKKLKRVSSTLYSKLEDTWNTWKWTRMWSLPPTYAPSTLNEFIEELKVKLTGDAYKQHSAKISQREKNQAQYRQLIEALALSPRERDFIDTVNHLAYFRTWRMEVSSRATYLVTPLLLEMGRRLTSLANPIDIVYLAPWEILDAWKLEDVPSKLLEAIAQRKQGYAVYERNGRPEFFSGNELLEFRENLLAVTNCNETGRGSYSVEESFVGGKGRNLLKLIQSNQNVPQFFVVTIEAFRAFISRNHLGDRLRELVSEEPTEENYAKILALFTSAEIPETIASAIKEQVEFFKFEQMAVRSSAAPEDAEGKSWAGRFSSVMYVDQAHLLAAIKQVWASLLNPIARRYATDLGVDLLDAGMAVVIQRMVDPDFSGVANTVRSLREPNIAEIEVAVGLGEGIVSGVITPDTYYVDKRDLTIIDKVVATQKIAFGAKGQHGLGPEGAQQKLNDDEIRSVAKGAKVIEGIYEVPQDIEFVVKNGVVYIVQARPQTGLGEIDSVVVSAATNSSGVALGKLVATGLKGKVETVFKGIARVIMSPEKGDSFGTGEILVAPVATPVWDAILYRAAAIVTDEGGATSHAIRVANERGIPAIVGTGDATRRIADGKSIALDTTGSDSFKGKVYRLEE